jgi:anti-anti-sigma factor
MDSTGLAVLLALSEELGRRQGTVTVTSPRPVVRRVITISGVHDRLGLE